MLSFLIGMVRHVKSTQNNKYAVSLQYLKKELSYKVDALPADKHGSLLQGDTIIFDGVGQLSPKYPGKFVMFFCHLKKEVRNEVRDLTALAGSTTTLTIYYTFNVLTTSNLFLSQYEMHTEPFSSLD